MNNLIGVIVSTIYIAFVLVTSKFVSKNGEEISRKYVHIMLCNIWIIYLLFIDSLLVGCILPAIFVVINTLSYKFKLIKSMEREENDGFGTIYYAISILITVIFSYWFDNPELGAIGILSMGYGDGLAALAGTNFKSKKFVIFGNEKTVIGSITMFVASFIAISILALCFNQFSIFGVLIVSAVATLIEAISPFGLDNITVPILTSILAYFVI